MAKFFAHLLFTDAIPWTVSVMEAEEEHSVFLNFEHLLPCCGLTDAKMSQFCIKICSSVSSSLMVVVNAYLGC